MIVTGGARGIGAATAKLAAARGYAVCINYQRDRDAAEQLVRDITGKCGHAVAIQADISSEPSVLALYRQVDSILGKVSALVNNAATLEPQMRLDAMEACRIERIFAVNVLGSMICAREAVRRMSTRHKGCGGGIVNVSSGAAKYGSPGEYVDYAASKGAIETFTVGLAKEVAQEGIRVNAVRPGHIYTELHAKGGEPQRVDRVKALVPMQRGGQPEEVANAILWLLSEEASYITGSMSPVAGSRCFSYPIRQARSGPKESATPNHYQPISASALRKGVECIHKHDQRRCHRRISRGARRRRHTASACFPHPAGCQAQNDFRHETDLRGGLDANAIRFLSAVSSSRISAGARGGSRR
jgi:NAD(P)-dependent dehydrogenase (short-subunit alcohol dehydrogenase family)